MVPRYPPQEGVLRLCNGSIAAKSMLWNGILTFLTFSIKTKIFFGFLVLASESRSVVSDSLRPHGLYSPWNSPGQITGVGSLSLLQGIFDGNTRPPDLLLFFFFF